MNFSGIIKSVTLSFSLVACLAANSPATVEYVLHKSDNPTEDELDAYRRITAVMDSAVYLYNKYTDLSKYINVYYAPGVPTAEASSNGDLRFGKERSYMFVGTAMHEMAHTMGMGTTSEYKAMMEGGVFKGERAQALLKEIDGPDAELHGDGQHFWPYGLNYASEVKSEQDLINHAKIVNAMYQDIFKEALFMQGRIKSLGGTKNCMGIAADNALELMDCSDPATFVKIFSMGENPVTYRIQLGSRVVDIPNESTAAGVVASTYGYNGGAHQKYLFESAPVNTPDAFYLKNSKSGHYLQAVEVQVQQNPIVDRDESFIWIISESVQSKDSSSTTDSTSVVKDSSGTDATEVVPTELSKPDSTKATITRIRVIRAERAMQIDAPKRMFDLKGRAVRKQTLGTVRCPRK